MQAWERARDLFRSARPVVVADSEQAWEPDATSAGDWVDSDIRLFWTSKVPGSGAPDCLAVAALGALENKGFRLPPWADVIAAGLAAATDGDMATLNVAHMRLWAIIRAAEPDPRHSSQRTVRYPSWEAFDEATDWPDDRPVDLAAPGYVASTHAGWLAQVVGAAAGTALEGYTMAQLAERFGRVTGYVRPPNTYNDDITFEIAFLDAYATCGPGLTGADIAERWVGLIPLGWSAEAVALDHLRRGVLPPDSGRTHNPFDEWIGAQMRGGVFGMVAPGRPREAARLAWLDGEISHTSNGILGAVFNAVLTAGAYVDRDLRTMLVRVVALFSERTEYGAVLARALATCRRAANWREAWTACDAELVRYHWIHAYPNAAAEIVALWFGANDFDAMAEIVCGIGHDVDCNAAQVLAVFAIMHGPDAIPRCWTEPLGHDVITYMRWPRRTSVAGLTDWTVAAARRWR